MLYEKCDLNLVHGVKTVKIVGFWLSLKYSIEIHQRSVSHSNKWSVSKNTSDWKYNSCFDISFVSTKSSLQDLFLFIPIMADNYLSSAGEQGWILDTNLNTSFILIMAVFEE